MKNPGDDLRNVFSSFVSSVRKSVALFRQAHRRWRPQE